MDNRADAFHQLVLAHIGLIRRIGASKLRTRRDLDDYVQSVLVAVYTSRGRVRYTDHLERWIAGVARNVAREWNRKREPIFTAELPEIPFPAPPADEVLSDRERWENVVAALAKLSPQEQELLRAYYLEERTSQELGSRLGVSQGAVYVRLTRARRSLRRKLGFVFGLATWVFARPKARAFGEIPLGSGRMSTAFSLMTSTLIVGWLGVSAGHVEQVAEDVATISAGGALPIRVVQLARAEGTPRPKVTPIVSHAARKEEQGMSKVLDIGPSHIYTTVVGALREMMVGAGSPEWSYARLQGVVGHAFGFVMRTGDGPVWQEAYLDYGDRATFLDMLPELGYRFQRFEAKAGDDSDRQQVMADAWAAVRQSIDRGVPAMAWNPMSAAQEEDGLRANIWGLLVGYDESDGTYTVRHQYVEGGSKPFTVRYDAVGETGRPKSWFCVLVVDTEEAGDPDAVHITALQNAVALAHGTRHGPADIGYRVDASGFAAYELWREGIDADVATPERARRHAWELQIAREHAIDYLRELVEILPAAADLLEEAAASYTREAEATQKLQDICQAAEDAGEFSEETRAAVKDMVTAALAADSDAIGNIKVALAVLVESP